MNPTLALSEMMQKILAQTALVIPAYNEAETLPGLIAEARALFPFLDITVVDDGSQDRTVRAARAAGARVLSLPCNLGVGGAVQTGFCDAWERGFAYVVRIDGDGQHPPAEILKLAAAMAEGGADLVIGSRYAAASTEYVNTWPRRLGIRFLAVFLSAICRRRITDPTSGFWMVNRELLACFVHYYPVDYPEPEALAFLSRQGYGFREVAATFRPRQAGVSSIGAWDTFYYAVKVGLALVADRMRPINPRFSKKENHP